MCKSLSGLRHTFALTLWALIAGGSAQQGVAQPAAVVPPAHQAVPAEDFVVVYPGVYTAREAALVQKYLADNAALKQRGPVDVQALIKGTLPKATPGIGPVVQVSEAMVRYDNTKYDWENPLRFDAAYARAAGFQDILAFPTFAAHDDTFMVPWPGKARDTLLVSDLNHSVTNYRPIYPGDTLYLVADERTVTDITPPAGSIYRSIAIQSKGSIYNQRGEKVNDVIFRVTESVKQYRDGLAPANPTFADFWEAPEWRQRPAHFYTDADWNRIKAIWAAEKRRGPEALYWEDVKAGDEPAATLDGPVEASVSPTAPWGMGLGGSRTLKKEIMDPALARTLVRSADDGIYRTAERTAQVPTPPGATIPPGGGGAVATPEPATTVDTRDVHKARADGRAIMINYMGRDMAIRHLGNWMGDRGTLRNIRWSIMAPSAHRANGKDVPASPLSERFLWRVPSLKGREVTAHPMTGDVALIHSYVYDKYVRDGAFLVDLAWWIETIDGQIYEEGGATVELPSRRAAGGGG
ncbi:MAG: MaoC family dehydratase [Gammaproteobacteria bacterium]|nr:MaoC family dehydratase [Gammaproteobacteria bacterium]